MLPDVASIGKSNPWVVSKSSMCDHKRNAHTHLDAQKVTLTPNNVTRGYNLDFVQRHRTSALHLALAATWSAIVCFRCCLMLFEDSIYKIGRDAVRSRWVRCRGGWTWTHRYCIAMVFSCQWKRKRKHRKHKSSSYCAGSFFFFTNKLEIMER